MIWNGELHQSVVGSGFLLVNLVCNTFLVSVCVRSSVLQSGVHRFALLSPRVILVGTVYGQLPVCVKSLYRLCEFLRVFQTWQPQLGLQDTIRDSPHRHDEGTTRLGVDLASPAKRWLVKSPSNIRHVVVVHHSRSRSPWQLLMVQLGGRAYCWRFGNVMPVPKGS